MSRLFPPTRRRYTDAAVLWFIAILMTALFVTWLGIGE